VSGLVDDAVSRDLASVPDGEAAMHTTEAVPGRDLWVVIPAFNERATLPATLAALLAQRDSEFTVLVVDNASTDGSADLVRDFARQHPDLDLRVVPEPTKGTGYACDTGMRHAIAAGARWLARTDADCLPDPEWTAIVRQALGSGLEMVTGRLRPRRDEVRLKAWEKWLLPAVIGFCATFGRFRPSNRDPKYLGPYMMSPGSNLALTASLYERCGGFPRTSIEVEHEDRTLVNRVRMVTAAYGRRRGMVVYGSVRRLRAYGLVGTLAWYLDHRNKPSEVDIR
jgi:glycosyltransferase involved in cell wall biosynthesis